MPPTTLGSAPSIPVTTIATAIWSVFQTPLKRAFPEWTESEVTLPAQILLAVFALAVVCGGRIQDRLGPRKVATAGGIILGQGLVKVEAKFSYQFTEPDGDVVERQFEVGDYHQAFMAAGVACLVAVLVCLLLRAPRASVAPK